jgi:hypothetical protein
MRTLRVSIAGTAILLLLAGLSGAVAAQDDPMAPAVVTGTVPEVSETFSGFVSPAGDAVDTKGYSVTERWEASDPRLSGTSTFTTNWREYSSADFLVLAATRVLENDDGRWVGMETGLGSDALFLDAIVLHGEDAYEGLTAYVVLDVEAEPLTFNAAIFPGEMPPFPELPAE